MANMAVQQEEAAAREKKSNKKVMGGLLMFGLILAHSVMRWVVLVGAVAALVGARLAGDRARKDGAAGPDFCTPWPWMCRC